MNNQELQELMAAFDLFDNALLYHGYTKYMRDYELLVEIHVGPAEQGMYSYLFRYCVESDTRISLPDHVYRRSLDDRLIDHESGKDLEGFVWGVNWLNLYPGWKLNPASERAAAWQGRIGISFHDIQIETNAYTINLIFSDLVVTKLSNHIDPGINRTYIPLR